MKGHIPFNKPYKAKNQIQFIDEVLNSDKISGNGKYTKLCQEFFCKRYGFNKCLLTSSCTDALEMSSLLIDVKNGDEIIIPSYTFVSTANAFALRGAKIIFADSEINSPNIDANKLEKLITSKTKAIVVVHYAGFSCDMDTIMNIANKYNLFVIEDAAQAIDNYYIDTNNNKISLGSIGHLATFSFHETKNIISGEGGMLVINDERFIKRAEIIWEKGTNRSAFFKGEVDKYGWVDLGSSFLPSEVTAAFLYAQLLEIDKIQSKRKRIWEEYFDGLSILHKKENIKLPKKTSISENNAHMFYFLCNNINERDKLIRFLKENNINAVFHYLSLHQSDFYSKHNTVPVLINSDYFSNVLIRLPLYFEMNHFQIKRVIDKIKMFYDKLEQE